MEKLSYRSKATITVQASSKKEADDNFKDSLKASKALSVAFNINFEVLDTGFRQTDIPFVKEFVLTIEFSFVDHYTSDLLTLSGVIGHFLKFNGFVQTEEKVYLSKY